MFPYTLEPGTWQLLQELMARPEAEWQALALAGGTNLALRFGHRLSVDLDFFSLEPFDKEYIRQSLEATYPSVRWLAESRQSLTGEVQGVKVQVLYHPYGLLEAWEIHQGIRLYSLPDLASMKLNAVNNRGSKKDFWDIAQLLHMYSMPDMLAFFAKKYPQAELASVIRSLTWFEEANQEPDPVDLQGLTWADIRQQMVIAMQPYLRTAL